MPDQITPVDALLNAPGRLAGTSGTADFATFGGQPDPAVGLAPGVDAAPPTDLLGTSSSGTTSSAPADAADAPSPPPADDDAAATPTSAPVGAAPTMPVPAAATPGTTISSDGASATVPDGLAPAPAALETGSLTPANLTDAQSLFELAARMPGDTLGIEGAAVTPLLDGIDGALGTLGTLGGTPVVGPVVIAPLAPVAAVADPTGLVDDVADPVTGLAAATLDALADGPALPAAAGTPALDTPADDLSDLGGANPAEGIAVLVGLVNAADMFTLNPQPGGETAASTPSFLDTAADAPPLGEEEDGIGALLDNGDTDDTPDLPGGLG